MRSEDKKQVLGWVALFAGLLLLVQLGGDGGKKAEAAPQPYAKVVFPAGSTSDGGPILCNRTALGPTLLVSGEVDQRTAIIQVREGAAAPVRIGPPGLKGGGTNKNGIQLKARESISWDVSNGTQLGCVVEDSDAGVWVDVLFGVGGR